MPFRTNILELKKRQILTYFIVLVWFINGFFCKVVNLVPRHQEIVERILGNDHARLLTLFIGILEIAMSAWVLSRIHSKINALVQISVVAIMNTMEFLLVPELLLWGRLNAFFALLFILLIFYNEFEVDRKLLLKQ